MLDEKLLAAWANLVCFECEDASIEHDSFNSGHEAYAVLLEEVEEFWAEIKLNDYMKAAREAIQVAAMALRFLIDCGPDPVVFAGCAALRRRWPVRRSGPAKSDTGLDTGSSNPSEVER